MLVKTTIFETKPQFLAKIFNDLKEIYNISHFNEERRDLIVKQVQQYGYLPYSHNRALNELSDAETIIGVEEKLKFNNTYSNNEIDFNELSPVKRAGYRDSSWVKREQHNIKLLNLAGLGNGNKTDEPGKLIDWLKQLLILPGGNLDKGILGTTMYLIPFHPRDFGCAYLPTSSGVSPNLADEVLQDKLGLDAKAQVQLFIALTQLAGHPVMFDVLPQTGRFSKTILTNPHAARWFNVKDLIQKLSHDVDQIAEYLKHDHHNGDVDYIKGLIKDRLTGSNPQIPDHLQYLADRFENDLNPKRKYWSEEVTKMQSQKAIHQKVDSIIKETVGVNKQLSEEDIDNQGEVIGNLIKQGFWPAPGGAWCSCGVPIFNKMSSSGNFPLFNHYDNECKDVTHCANLDCQTPYYFVSFEDGKYNTEVIDFYVNFMKKLQSDYNFDGFRVDHIDHIVDKYSENEDGDPISYRAPKYVLKKTNDALKAEVPHFAALAEYMLWDNYYHEYHVDMNFDLFWGNDIVSQFAKNVEEIINNNSYLAGHNNTSKVNKPGLGILKTYNNQDGEFREINQYPGQLGERGALFKWFKYKFLPGGANAQRPVMYIDGDESYTEKGIEKAIGAEKSMSRNENEEFYREFDSIDRLAKQLDLACYGVSEQYHTNFDESGFITWFIRNENGLDEERLFIVANENAPKEIVKDYMQDGNVNIYEKISHPVFNKDAFIPEGFQPVCEYVLELDSYDFREVSDIHNHYGDKFYFEKLEPGEYHIYKIKRV